MEAIETVEPIEETIYPSLIKRLKAAFIDVCFIILFMYGISDLFSTFETVPTPLRKAAFVFIFLLYDPLSIAFFGGTIGHWYMGLRVKRNKDESKNISLLMAIIRFFIKAAFGWFSFLTMSRSAKKQAIHDHIAQSVVVFETKKSNPKTS